MYGTWQTIVIAAAWFIVLAGLPFAVVWFDRWSRGNR